MIKKYFPFSVPFFVYAFPCVFLYCQNIRDTSFVEAVPALLAFVGLGYALFFAGLALFKSRYAAAIFSGGAGMLLLNYGIFNKIFLRFLPLLRKWQIVPILIIIIAVIIYLASKKAPKLCEGVAVAMCLLYTSLFAINVITALPVGISKFFAPRYISDTENLQISADKNRSNIYYLIYDEFASFDQSERYLGYKNESLLRFFDENNFNVSNASYNDYNSTHEVITNILMLDYVVTQKTDAATMKNLRKTAPIYDILDKAGYTAVGSGNYGWLMLNSKKGAQSAEKSVTVDGTDFTQLLLKNTAFSKGGEIELRADTTREFIQNDLDALDNLKLAQNSSQFVFYYVSSPHPPYLFTQNGEENVEALYGANEEQYYLSQLQYVSTRMETAIAQIIKNDPDSIIMVTSDHGFRFNAATPHKETKRVLNSIYYKNQKLDDFEGLSGVNTMRYVLNKELGTKMEYKELPADE